MMDRRRRLAVVDHDRQAEAEKPASRSERVQARCETADKEAGPARPRDRDAVQRCLPRHHFISGRNTAGRRRAVE
jgi:hypothetical protein